MGSNKRLLIESRQSQLAMIGFEGRDVTAIRLCVVAKTSR